MLACRATAFALLKAGMFVDKDIDTTSSLHFRNLVSWNLSRVSPFFACFARFSAEERDHTHAQAQVLWSRESSDDV